MAKVASTHLRVDDDTVEAWRLANREALSRHGGQRVAIHPQRGIVAADKDLRKVLAAVRALGLQEEVVIELVR